MNIEISVIMSVFNEPLEYLRCSIRSILEQSYKKFEFIIVLDNPKNQELRDFLIKISNTDNRIKLLINDKNEGLAYSLNKAASIAVGRYIARMDADDVSDPQRLEKEYLLLKSNSKLAMIFTNIEYIDERGYGDGNSPLMVTDKDDVAKLMRYQCPIPHPTVLIRRSVFNKMGGYNLLPTAQDYDLWFRMTRSNFSIQGINEPLLKYRLRDGSITSNKWRTYLYTKGIQAVEKRQSSCVSSISVQEEINSFVIRHGLNSIRKRRRFNDRQIEKKRAKELIKNRHILHGAFKALIILLTNWEEILQIPENRSIRRVFRHAGLM